MPQLDHCRGMTQRCLWDLTTVIRWKRTWMSWESSAKVAKLSYFISSILHCFRLQQLLSFTYCSILALWWGFYSDRKIILDYDDDNDELYSLLNLILFLYLHFCSSSSNNSNSNNTIVLIIVYLFIVLNELIIDTSTLKITNKHTLTQW
jgi:hypothetical protein